MFSKFDANPETNLTHLCPKVQNLKTRREMLQIDLKRE